MRPEFERTAGSGQWHGGPIAAAIDVTGDFALAMLIGNPLPTINFSVDYLRPASGNLTLIARVRRRGKTVGVVDVDVLNEAGVLLAVGRASYSTADRVNEFRRQTLRQTPDGRVLLGRMAIFVRNSLCAGNRCAAAHEALPHFSSDHGLRPVGVELVVHRWHAHHGSAGRPLWRLDRHRRGIGAVGTRDGGCCRLPALPASLFSIRLLFGLGHSMLIAATAASISREFGNKERARAVAFAYSGNQVGLAAGATVAAFILVRSGWQAVFYWMGGSSLVLSAAWFFFYPDKRIGARTSQPNARSRGSSWLDFFRHRSTWGIALGQLGYLYALGVFVSWLPGYLVLERKMTLLKSGVVSAIPFWVGLLATLAGGWLGDYLVKRGVTTTRSRKGIIGTGLTAATLFVSSAAFVKQDWLAVTLLTLCVGCIRLTTGISQLSSDRSGGPRAVGTLSSIQNFFGNIGAVLAPIVTGYLVNSTGSFTIALVVAGGLALFGAAAYVFVLGDIDEHRLKLAAPGSPM